MNNLDNAIKGLQGALNDVTSQIRVLQKEGARIEKALNTLTGGRDVAAITGVNASTNKGKKLDYPDGKEMRRRRDLVNLWLDTGDSTYPSDFMAASGEPVEMTAKYRQLIQTVLRERREEAKNEHPTYDSPSGLPIR